MSSPDLCVCCVLWVGRWKKPRPYNSRWVYLLKAMVARNLSQPFRFVCLSNVYVDGIDTIRLDMGLPGWWSKIEVFSHNLGKRVLYLDLDVLVTGSLDEIVAFPADIAFSPPHHVIVGVPEPRSLPGLRPHYQTSCFVWSPPAGYEILSRFTRSAMDRLHGDQDWIAEVSPDYAIMPREWFGKLRHCLQGPKPEMKVVFGGAVKNDNGPRWAKEVWAA